MPDQEAVDARVVEITFINGRTRTFAFEPIDNADTQTFQTALQRFSEAGYVLLETDDGVIYIPMSSVLSLEVTPKPNSEIEGATRILFEL